MNHFDGFVTSGKINKHKNKYIIMRIVLIFLFITSTILTAFSQEISGIEKENKTQDGTFLYAYVRVQGKAFSKKLKVDVDFGDTSEQLKDGEKYSKILTNKKSYAAVLNHMAEDKFVLVQTLELTESFQGSGGTSGVVFIMKKKKE